MHEFATQPGVVRPDDPTLESALPSGTRSVWSEGGASNWGTGRPDVALIEGSSPELARETQELLRSRLRMAALVLFFAFATFLVLHYLRVDISEPGRIFLFFFHLVATIVLGGVGISLCRRGPLPSWWVRASEWLIFGLPAVFFAAMQYSFTLASCQRGVLHFPQGLWLVLIYTYALFIPNTVRRAAVAVGLMSVTPLALLFGMMWGDPMVRQCVATDEAVGLVLMFCVACGGSVLGVGLIGSLRRAVFVARQFGQYKLTRRIGAGGMGEVYLAEHQLLKRPCVVKLIRPDRAGDPRNLARFQREVRATAKLSHWNTVEIFDYGRTADGTFYYVMEYLPGMSLGEIIDRFGPMPPERVIHLLRQACDALAEAHGAGLVHRDIKPGNIFAAKRGGFYDVAKLLDFGLVKPLMEEEPIHLTAEGTITGSPLFMSPEQALGETNPDGRSDIYSLGAVGYYLLTGHPPFEGDAPLKVIFAHAHQPVVPPASVRPEVPTDLDRVILRCLEKNPADRFQSAVELEEALAGCASAGLWTQEHATRWWQDYDPETTIAEVAQE
jgi:eukaryotic-like serine/threonine-protein kinase